jgi:hypothetical protein
LDYKQRLERLEQLKASLKESEKEKDELNEKEL